jgi:5-methylcytosine-specific restriction endonuclease McrA
MKYICENCEKEHNGSYGSGRFCTKKCAKAFSTKEKRSLINDKVSKTLKEKPKRETPKLEYICEKCGNNFWSYRIKTSRKKHCENCKRKVVHFKNEKELQSILDLSKTTISRVLIRADKKCARCGWNESSLDIHHIRGRKTENATSLSNLVILCPNCHRLAHTHKINIEELEKISMDKTFNDWIKYYHPSN